MNEHQILDNIIMDEALRRAEYGVVEHDAIARAVAKRACIVLTRQNEAPAWLLKQVTNVLEREF